MMPVTPTIRLADSEFAERFIPSPGPGGQNVNKVATLYRLRAEKGISKAEALRQPQLAFLGRGALAPRSACAASESERATPVRISAAGDTEAAAFTPDPSAPYAHPYYWAPFILMGNWL